MFVVFSKSSDIPRVSFKLPECSATEKIEDCLISQGPPVKFLIFTTFGVLLQLLFGMLHSLCFH